MTVRTRAQLLSDIATYLADNNAGDISAEDLRLRMIDIVDSMRMIEDGIDEALISAAVTLDLTHAQKKLIHPSADTTARIWTIPANASVAFPIDTVITFINQHGAGTITIAITTDTMRLAGAGTTGSRTLAANGIATATKVTATEWIISGTGLS